MVQLEFAEKLNKNLDVVLIIFTGITLAPFGHLFARHKKFLGYRGWLVVVDKPIIAILDGCHIVRRIKIHIVPKIRDSDTDVVVGKSYNGGSVVVYDLPLDNKQISRRHIKSSLSEASSLITTLSHLLYLFCCLLPKGNVCSPCISLLNTSSWLHPNGGRVNRCFAKPIVAA